MNEYREKNKDTPTGFQSVYDLMDSPGVSENIRKKFLVSSLLLSGMGLDLKNKITFIVVIFMIGN